MVTRDVGSDPPGRALAWAVAAVGTGARLLEMHGMPEAGHANHRLSVESAAGTRIELVLRRYTDTGRLAADPWYRPDREVEALDALEGVDVPVPRLIAADTAPNECDVPSLLLSWLPGSPPSMAIDGDALARGLAEHLPTIHAVPPSAIARTYEPYFASDGHAVRDLRPPRWSRRRRLWERVLEVVSAPPPAGPTRFIHRDYHHGNTLWRDNELTGIVDWTAACAGPPAIDIARTRLNLAGRYDLEVADRFLSVALDLEPDCGYDPYWDLLDAAEAAIPAAEPPVATWGIEGDRRFEGFVERVLAGLD